MFSLIFFWLFVCVSSQSPLLLPPDEFANELQKADEFCRPPPMSLVNVYGGIANNIPKNDPSERTQMSKVDWSNLLSPAPTAIAIMGNLLLVTATRDVSLADRPPVGGWKYVKRPNSLRASMLQVSDEAYRALLNAHDNMDRIRLQTGNVPIYFKQISKLLARGKPKEKELYLPLTLGRIEDVTSTCSYLANKTAQQFKNVSLLVEELLRGCVGTQQLTKEELEEVEIDLAATNIEVERVEDDVDRYEKHADEATKRIDESFTKLQKVIDDAPSGWELLGASLADAVIGMVKEPFAMFGLGSGKDGGSSSSSQPQKQQEGETAAEIFTFKTLITRALHNNQFIPLSLVKKLIKGKKSDAKSEAIKLKRVFKNEKLAIGHYLHIPKELSTETNSLFESGIEICSEIAEKSKASLGSSNNGSFDDMDTKCTDWGTRVGALVQRLGKSLGIKDMEELSMASTQQINSNPSGSISSQMMNSWRHRMAAQEQLLVSAQEKYEFEQKRLDEANRRAGKLLAELSRLNMTETNLKETIRILKEAIKELGRLQVQWRQLERFFRQVSRIVNDKWQKRMNEFSQQISVMLDQKGLVNQFDFGTDMLYKSAFRATSLNYRIHRLASTYVQISDAHFLPPLATMTGLLTLDPKKDKQGFEAERTRLNGNVDRAKSDIEKLIMEDRQLLKDGLTVYRNNLHEQFKLLCPPEENDEEKVLKITEESVKKGNEQSTFDFSGGF